MSVDPAVLLGCAAAFSRLSWRSVFSVASTSNGLTIERSGRVKPIAIDVVHEHCEFTASVRSQAGTDTYRTWLRFPLDGGGKLETDCTCPVRFHCKHAAAMAQHLALKGTTSPTSPKSGSALDASTVLDANNVAMWERWLSKEQATPALQELRVDLDLRQNDLLLILVARGSGNTLKSFTPLKDFWASHTIDPWESVHEQDRDWLADFMNLPRAEGQGVIRRLSGLGSSAVLSKLLQLDKLHVRGRAAARVGTVRPARVSWTRVDHAHQQLRVSVDPPALVLDTDRVWYFDPVTDEFGLVSGAPSAQELQKIKRAPKLRDAVMAQIGAKLSGIPFVPPLVHLEDRSINEPCRAVLRLARCSNPYLGGASMFVGTLFFRYGTIEIAAKHPPHHAVVQGNVRYLIERDTQSETDFRHRLWSLGFQPAPGLEGIYAGDLSSAAEDWLERAEDLRRAGYELRYPADFSLSVMQPPDEWFADFEGEPGSAWFDLELGIRVGNEKISLLPLVEHALKTKRFSLSPEPDEPDDASFLARIDEERRIRLPKSKLRALVAPIMEWIGHIGQRTSLRLPRLRADLADAYGAELKVKADARMQRLAEALKSDLMTRTLAAPDALQAQLRDYQLDGLRWLDFLGEHGFGGVLADDMGLGKTVQVLAHLLRERELGRMSGPVLVVVPTSLVPNWQNEVKRFAPLLKLVVLHGSTRWDQPDALREANLVLTTYALLARDLDLLRAISFELAVFDEAQVLKNPSTKVAMAARGLRCERKLLVTGTPIENHLGELWSGIDLVLPGLLGTQKEFNKQFRQPIEKHSDAERRERLTRRLRPFLLRRSKHDVARELPAKTEIVHCIELEGPQRELYESLRIAMHERVRSAIASRGLAQSSIVVLDALLKLRQVCCDPALVKLPSARKVARSAKRSALLELLEPLLDEGRRVLVFSQFTEMLNLIQVELNAKAIGCTRIDGSTRDRAEPVRAFQALEVPVMLISLKAGGVGLNLTAADTVIHYDPWWNPAVENQATDRAHRIGQDKPVFVYKLVCIDTVEDRILAMQSSKAELAAAILDGGSSSVLQFDAETVEELFAGP